MKIPYYPDLRSDDHPADGRLHCDADQYSGGYNLTPRTLSSSSRRQSHGHAAPTDVDPDGQTAPTDMTPTATPAPPWLADMMESLPLSLAERGVWFSNFRKALSEQA